MARQKGSRTGRCQGCTVVANHPDDLKGTLKLIGGSRSDRWNNVLAYQAVETLWLKNSDKETRDEQYDATVAGLIGIGPRDELEGMMAAQLLAAHNAAMECYRRAMIREQTFEGRRESLSQANKPPSRLFGRLPPYILPRPCLAGVRKPLTIPVGQASPVEWPLWRTADPEGSPETTSLSTPARRVPALAA